MWALGLVCPAHVLDLATHIALDAHPLVRVVGPEVRFAVDHDGGGQEIRRDAHAPTATAARTLLPALDHGAALRRDAFHLLAARESSQVVHQHRVGRRCRANGQRTFLDGDIQRTGVDIVAIAAQELVDVPGKAAQHGQRHPLRRDFVSGRLVVQSYQQGLRFHRAILGVEVISL